MYLHSKLFHYTKKIHTGGTEMFNEKILCEFAKLVLKIGVNLQKGQGLEIACPTEKAEVAHVLAETAYKMGAKIVKVRWEDEITDKINYLHASESALTDIPKWLVASKNYIVEKGFCYVAISAENPSAFKDVPATKLAAVAKAKSRALKKFSDAVMANDIRWCIASVPTKDWAKHVYGDRPDAETLLTHAIEKTMRLDAEDPVAVWEEHIHTLEQRAAFMNMQAFEYIHFKNSIGTDLKVGLAEDNIWLSARERAADGLDFIANIPTEEVFTAPHRLKTEGVVKSSMPLSYNGQIIENFSILFKKGKACDFYAEKGFDVLKHLIKTDKGTPYLGEVALIGKSSPVAETGTLFYNTLFDENASCHLAFGKAYPTTVRNGNALSPKELAQKGVNESVEHVDFMIGTPDLSVTGIKKDGSEIPIFTDGEWCI